jgi:hypothetical protein
MTFFLTRLLILLSALLISAGWILSAAGQLNSRGYAVVFLIAAPFAWRWLAAEWRGLRPIRWSSLKRRIRRPFAAAFFFLALLTLLGGMLYAPSNYDALAYRIPRTLHWLAEGHWHWIHTSFHRMNTRAQGCEWIMAPALVFFGSERIMWVPNFLMFLTLPGLLFITLRGAGVARRVAWQWMWLLPCGYTFVLEAGGMSNDLPGVFCGLAAVALALRARASRRISDVGFSMLAVALASGMKASNLPLALPWLVAVWPALPLLRGQLATGVVAGLFAALCSFLPGAMLNIKYCGDWSGSVLEFGAKNNFHWGVTVGNALGLTAQNLVPPIFPFANRWNAALPRILPAVYHDHIGRYFEGGSAILTVMELQVEEGAGLGCTAGLMLLVTLAAKFRKGEAARSNLGSRALRWAPWIALLFYMSKMNLIAAGRLASPYYPLLIAAIVAGSGAEWISRRRWWLGLAMLHFAAAALLVVVSPARPLWPALSVLNRLAAPHPNSAVLQRMRTVYSVYRQRPDVMAPVRAALPVEAKLVGLVTGDDLETSLWRPLISRRFEHVTNADTSADLERGGIRWLVISSDAFRGQMAEPLPIWLHRMNAKLVRTIPIQARAAAGPVDWHLAVRSDSATEL